MASVSLLCTASLVLASGSTPDGRYSHSLTTLADGTAVLFGGNSYDGYVNDVHTLEVSGALAMWTDQISSGDVPSGRYGHSLTVLADGTAVLFGGRDGSKLNDIYTLEVSSSEANWTELSSSGDVPSGRYWHSLTVLADGTAVLFGGYDGSRLNDIYTLEVSSSEANWTELSSSGDVPSGRYWHSLTVLADGTAVLFGGYDGSRLNDIYILEVSSSEANWTELSSSGDVPSGRYWHSLTVLADGTAVMFGGYDGSRLNDIYTLGGVQQRGELDGIEQFGVTYRVDDTGTA